MLLLMKKILTIKIKLIFFILIAFLISQKSNADFKIDYYRWLLENNQTVNLDKEKKLKRWLFDNKRLGEKFKWDSNPSLEKLHYQVFHFNKQHDDWDKHIIEGSNNPYKFKINLKENRKKLIKSIDKEFQKSGLLSYLLFENDEIVIDKKSPDNRLGLLFDDDTKWTTASVGKSFTSYVVGQAICDGYIKNVDVKLNDWPLIKNTLYENVKLIDLLNMAAGDQKYSNDESDLVNTRPRNPNVNSLKYHMAGHFKGSKPSKNKYNYSNIVANILINYVWFKSNGDFQKITDKVFKEKARIEDSIYFLKISGRSTRGMKDGIRYKYEVDDEDGPLRYSMELNRYDFLRVAKAMLDDWKNNTCVGKYLKTINERKISKNHKERKPTKSYGGQFHFDYSGFKNRNIFGLDGAYGQSILIDMDNSKIVSVNSIHTNYNWQKIALSALK
tara:strand:+ start:53 stop:1381 length:1329 start_codon:yes stop_codon:yes gene_type:complete